MHESKLPGFFVAVKESVTLAVLLHCFSRSILGRTPSFDKAAVAAIRATALEITIIDRMCMVASAVEKSPR
jgi:hypothetical protein